ncbi:hypothetical protein LC612_05100 [Nostoc sp. CHAB 5834]|nr:hypothetical protein [Nostoc sp. CHAB 5834]
MSEGFGEYWRVGEDLVDRKVFQKPYQSLISAWEYNPPKSACNLPFKNFCSGRTFWRSQLVMIASPKNDG